MGGYMLMNIVENIGKKWIKNGKKRIEIGKKWIKIDYFLELMEQTNFNLFLTILNHLFLIFIHSKTILNVNFVVKICFKKIGKN